MHTKKRCKYLKRDVNNNNKKNKHLCMKIIEKKKN